MRDIIKQYFKGYSKKGIPNALPKFIKNNSEVELYLNNILTENPNWESIKNIVYGICFDEQLKKCKNCGKEMKYSQRTLSYCSYKCSRNSKEVREKVKQTNLERYGCEHPLQNKEVQEKYKQTCLEKYGCENPAQSKEVQEKAKQTCLERFGCEYASQNKDIQEKAKQTCLERFGCGCSLQNEEIQKKVKQTCLERFGCENPAQNENIKNKIKQTNLERYNVENIFQSEEFQEKFKQTCLERYGCEHPMQSEKVKQTLHDNSFDNFILSFIQYGITPLFSKEEYIGWDKTYRWKCLNCGTEFEQKIHTTGHVEECPYLPHCWKCYPRMTGESRVELELLDFVKQYYPNAHKDNELIKPQELDIIIPELNLAIEFNGDYWHSTEFKLPGFHLNKVLKANKKGYRLIHFWENEYNNLILKLKDILEGKENLNFTEDTIKLDRSFYNSIEIPGYKLVEELQPEIVNRNEYNVENCGYLVYKRIK